MTANRASVASLPPSPADSRVNISRVSSLEITTEVELVRRYAAGNSYAARDPYQGVAVITYAHPLCTVTGMLGTFKRQDFLAIMHHARDRGAMTMVVERTPGRRMPWASAITGGPLDGWWQIDLTDLPELLP